MDQVDQGSHRQSVHEVTLQQPRFQPPAPHLFPKPRFWDRHYVIHAVRYSTVIAARQHEPPPLSGGFWLARPPIRLIEKTNLTRSGFLNSLVYPKPDRAICPISGACWDFDLVFPPHATVPHPHHFVYLFFLHTSSAHNFHHVAIIKRSSPSL